MRSPSIAAGIITLALAAWPAASWMMSRASAAALPAAQEAGPGPMTPPSGNGQSTAAPQQQAPPMVQQPLQVRTAIVNVFVTVRDHHNGIVSDLGKDDFKVYEDGAEQKLAYFSKEVDMPISLGLLMDTSGSMSHIFVAEQDAATRFVREVMRKRDEAMVISFDTDSNLLADFTEDQSELDSAIHRAQVSAVGVGGVVTPGPIPQNQSGGTNLFDAVYLACHDKLAGEAGRKAIVMLTDGEDNGSTYTEQDAIAAAQRSDAVIHVVLIRDFMATEGYGVGIANRMAEQTGGRVIPVRNDKSLEKAFDEISEELRSQYVLGYYPSNSARDGTFRKIKVEVSHPDTKVLARKGYFAPMR